MFNLFKKSENKNVVVDNSTKEYPSVVKEIHNSFMSAGEKLLKDAKAIIANAEIKDEEKVNRLKKIGFINAGQVRQTEAAMQKKQKAEQDAAIVEMYAVRYPNYKFITEEIVKQICDKYKLIMGAISKYQGFVPEKNLLEIESFRVHDEDCNEVRPRSYMEDIIIRQMMSVQNMQLRSGIGGINFIEEQRRRAYLFAQQTSQFPSFVEETPTPKPEAGPTYKREFLICAPQKDMKIESWERVEGNKIVHIPDPVVLHPVKHGYLIVTAWGDEASDELVVNQTHN